MPAARAISVVGVPYRPRSPTTFIAARSTSSRRSSAVESVRVGVAEGAFMSVSMHSLTPLVKGPGHAPPPLGVVAREWFRGRCHLADLGDRGVAVGVVQRG